MGMFFFYVTSTRHVDLTLTQLSVLNLLTGVFSCPVLESGQGRARRSHGKDVRNSGAQTASFSVFCADILLDVERMKLYIMNMNSAQEAAREELRNQVAVADVETMVETFLGIVVARWLNSSEPKP